MNIVDLSSLADDLATVVKRCGVLETLLRVVVDDVSVLIHSDIGWLEVRTSAGWCLVKLDVASRIGTYQQYWVTRPEHSCVDLYMFVPGVKRASVRMGLVPSSEVIEMLRELHKEEGKRC